MHAIIMWVTNRSFVLGKVQIRFFTTNITTLMINARVEWAIIFSYNKNSQKVFERFNTLAINYKVVIDLCRKCV